MSTHNTHQFLDQVCLTIESGHGGAGSVSFRREAMTPRGGPDGGDGGRGGHLYFRSTRQKTSLIDYSRKKHFRAANGLPGRGANMSGQAGDDLYLLVPVGTILTDENGNVLKDFQAEEEFLILEGGRGGKGNAFFKTSVNQAPEHSQPGEEGQVLVTNLELKLIADAGIIGFPNAGKSTLISRLSAAKPRIANYPFTTLVPHLGVVTIDEDHSFVLADIPGLIPGAHRGVGLGLEFLRHVQRTRVLIHMIDVADAEQNPPWESYHGIREELKKYDEQNHFELGLHERDELVVFNKIEVISKDELEKLKKEFKKKTKILPQAISAVTGEGLKELRFQIWKMIQTDRGPS